MWLEREIVNTFPGGEAQINDNGRKVAFLAKVLEARLLIGLSKNEIEVKLLLTHILPLSEGIYGKRTNFTPVPTGWAKGAEIVRTLDLNQYHGGNIGPSSDQKVAIDRFVLESPEETVVFTPAIDVRQVQYQETHLPSAS